MKKQWKKQLFFFYSRGEKGADTRLSIKIEDKKETS